MQRHWYVKSKASYVPPNRISCQQKQYACACIPPCHTCQRLVLWLFSVAVAGYCIIAVPTHDSNNHIKHVTVFVRATLVPLSPKQQYKRIITLIQ